MLPLLLGIIGLIYQTTKDKRNAWIVFCCFLNGLAIVIYLNQPPYQPRERDYAYAGSFMRFHLGGIGSIGLAQVFRRFLKPVAAGVLASVLCLFVPFQMLSQNWDDHNRSGGMQHAILPTISYIRVAQQQRHHSHTRRQRYVSFVVFARGGR